MGLIFLCGVRTERSKKARRAYRNANSIIITGRAKDLIIINSRNVWPQDLESIAEQQSEVRTGDASAFSLPGAYGTDIAVLLVQCRDPEKARLRIFSKPLLF